MRASIRGGDDLRRLARRLREAQRDDLRRELAKAVKAAGEPTVAALKAKLRVVPVRGFPKPNRKRRYTRPSGPTALRATLAASIGMTVTMTPNGAKVTVTTGRGNLPTNLATMPKRLDNPRGWRHPVQGNREVWVKQLGQPWWWSAIEPNLKLFRSEIDDAIGRIVEKLERGI